MKRVAIAAGLILALTAARDDPLAGRVPGDPVSCIPQSIGNAPVIEEDGRLLFREGAGRRIFVTRARGECEMRPLDTLIVEQFGGGLCRNDRFRVVQAGTSIPGPYCLFDSFTPYTLPKRR